MVLETITAHLESYAAGTAGGGGSDAGNVVGADAGKDRGAHQTFIQVEDLQKPLCGQSRPHFFRELPRCDSPLVSAFLLPPHHFPLPCFPV